MSGDPVGEVERSAEGERAQVVAWRACKLMRVGVESEVAWRIAEELEVDVSSVLPRLAGCPPELIASILE